MIMSKYKTIVIENNLDEIDTLGLLLEKYTEGTHYDFDTSSLTRDNLIWLYINYDTLHTQSCKYVYEVFQEEKGQTFPDIQL